MKPTLTFYNGIEETGGVQVSFNFKRKALFFDMGITHGNLFTAPYIHMKDPMTSPIYKRELRQFLLTGYALPQLSLFDEKAVGELTEEDMAKIWKGEKSQPYEEARVFISHTHQDHMALLPYLKKGTIVYMHEDSYTLYKAMVKADYCYETKANIRTFKSNETIEWEEMKITTLEMDHDIPGSSGFMLEADEYSFAATGDWRAHGRHYHRVKNYIEKTQSKNIDVLLTESTMVENQSSQPVRLLRKERVVLDEFKTIIQTASSLVYFMTLPFNVERLIDCIKIAKEEQRNFVIEERVAEFLKVVSKDNLCGFTDKLSQDELENIRILEPNSNKKFSYSTVTVKEIAENKSNFIVMLHYASVPYLAEFENMGECTESSVMIQADAPMDKEKINKWLHEYSIHYYDIGNKGHAAPHEITKLVKGIHPKLVVPIHGENGKMLDTGSIKKFVPQRGETLHLK